MTKAEKKYLELFCKRCKKQNNGKCIKHDPYIGLCAENDAEELLEWEKRRGVLK